MTVTEIPEEESLTIDLTVTIKQQEPDEIIGRMLNIPETWLEPEKHIHT